MTLDGIMFDNFFFSPFAVIVGLVRAKTSARPHIFDGVVMPKLFKVDVFELLDVNARITGWC